ncbi:MAG: hypothetical protein HY019_11535 [Aquabacterium sp.]|uniref:hypothetical protein n=1 Tax=Aquabacterium sp. TaxID=1872578 RepID=UPI0025C47BE8|nr:hypothetical protein [Aquabacterium sp.]MBI3382627.1 hypothetical protein [Aquabacterium sp.]
MNNFKRVSAAVLAGMTLLCAAGASYGLGFGHASSRAVLGDTLKVSVPLRLEPGEEIPNECVAADVYFGDDKVSPKVIFTEVLAGEGRDRVLYVGSTIAISEPVVTIYLAAGCKSRITRKIVTFPDPPGASVPLVTEASPVNVAETIQAATLPATGTVSPPGALPGRKSPSRMASPQASTLGDSPVQANKAARSAKAVKARSAVMPSMTVADVAAPASDKPVSAGAAPSRKAGTKGRASPASEDGGRLLLDPADTDAMVIPNLRMTPSLGSPTSAEDASPEVAARRQTAAAIWLALNASPEQMARDRDRLQQLEQRLAQLKQEGDQAQQNMAALKTRLQKAESGTGRSSYVLWLLLLAALGLSAYLYQRLRQERKRSESWWHSQAQSNLSEQDLDREPELSRTSAEFVHVPSGSSSTEGQTEAGVFTPMATEPSRPLTSATIHKFVPDAVPPAIQMPPVGAAHSEPLREVSVEELIDLEQQAEFFVVLGQDDAAIDLLEGHVHHTTGASPLPFLKLLEIYRRVGKRTDYERVQAEFNQRFNAYAPAWDADLQQGHMLEDYPGVIERLQALWAEPVRAMAVLEKSLTRPESGDDTFELPAYRELLFLYAVARDLSERDIVDRHSVDLLLPVVDLSANEPAASVHAAPVIEPLMATRPIKAQPEASPSMNLDLHLDDLHVTPPDQRS